MNSKQQFIWFKICLKYYLYRNKNVLTIMTVLCYYGNATYLQYH